MEINPFLKEVAVHLLSSGKYNLQETCVVFPNKRARLYLSKYLGELTETPIWAPAYLTINELMQDLSGLIYADKLTLIFELFKIYKKVTNSNESFDVFYPYSEILLADFDEIDKYLVNAKDLFQNLADIKDLEGRFNYLTEEQIHAIRRFWSTFNPVNSSKSQETFLSLWNKLPNIYSELNNNLVSKGLSYEGMAYRKVAEGFEEYEDFPGLIYKKYLFVGFNALNRCEDKLFRYLMNQQKADFFWDYDTYYTNNSIHEAGFFIRENLRKFPQHISTSNENLIAAEKKISFLPAPSNTGQAGAIPFLLKQFELSEIKEIERTALVLADETLLMPALYSIPGEISDVNITMGYPLADSLIFNLIDSLYNLNRNNRQAKNGEYLFYYKDVLSIMNNHLIKELFQEKYSSLRQSIIEGNRVYIKAAELNDQEAEQIIFNNKDLFENPIQYLYKVFDFVLRRQLSLYDEEKLYLQIQLEMLYQVHGLLTRLTGLVGEIKTSVNAVTIFRLVRKMLRTQHVAFSGEPLAGLQILGILETRTLDFENVIILSMNEGILPKAAQIPSFIPVGLRIGFNLPTPEHQDSIYAYYFYRLIQRAKNIAIVYNSNTEGLKTGEQSRFLHQLYYEMPKKITEIALPFTISPTKAKAISVIKTDDILAKLENYLDDNTRLLSPSAINEFLNCSLRFYFHHVAGLPEPDEVSEEVDPALFGSLLHKTMKILYLGLGSEMVTPEKLKVLLKNEALIDRAIATAFNEELFHEKNESKERKVEGFNLVISHIVKTYIRQLIQFDIMHSPFQIESLEKRYQTKIPIHLNGQARKIIIGGIIDRIDVYEGKIRIIDYKTGEIKSVFKDVESLFSVGKDLRNDAAFQVLLYSLVYSTLNPGREIVPALYFIRGSHSENYSYHLKYGPNKEQINEFKAVSESYTEQLGHHLTRIFDREEPFQQTTNLKICEYCPYVLICHRQQAKR